MVTLILTIAIVGFLAWAVVAFIPMPEKVKTVIYVVAGIVIIALVLNAFGLDVPVPQISE